MRYLKKLEERSSNRKQRSKLVILLSSFFLNVETLDLHSHSWPYEQPHQLQEPHDQTSAQLARHSTAGCAGTVEAGSGER